MSTENISWSDHIYNVFHPWSDRVPEDRQVVYWISFVAITILTLCIVPILYYLISCCCSPQSQAVKPIERVSLEEGSVPDQLQNAVAQTAVFDLPAHNHGWQSYACEKNVSFGNFTQKLGAPPIQKPVVIQLIGEFSDQEKLMVRMTADFMRATHRTNVRINKTIQPSSVCREIEHRQKGAYEQYHAESMALRVEDFKPGDVHILGLTSQDLFTHPPGPSNFVIGYGNHQRGSGIWSKSRLIDPNPTVMLRRMMGLAAHEYGHMRYLSHCTDYACLMNGGISVAEIEENPLLLCSQDVAKVCWMSGVTLPEYYTHLLEFFTQFNSKYKTRIDFSVEIKQIQNKLEVLKEENV